MNIDFPISFDHRGRTAAAGRDDHIRGMVEQLLFTSPGERVNRPEFGCGAMQLIFAPNSDQLAAAVQANIQAGIERWLGDVIEIQGLEVSNDDSVLRITLAYMVLKSGEVRVDTFERSAAS